MTDEISFTDDLSGSESGGYRILSRIGSGTMGHVYDAQDVTTGRHVALKVLRKSNNKELNARFVREGKTLALLSHPNIVQLIDSGQLDDGTLFLATELVSGGSLQDLMKRGPIEHRRALRLVRQLLDALRAAHELGVVHRDIKPENVMLADGDFVKVLDFGVAKLLQDTVAGLGEANLTSVGFSVFGSALYISPESVTGQPLDARADIYSTGAMLFEMVAGRPPFDDDDPTVLLRAHAFDAPPTLQQASPTQSFAPALEALVARALAKKPEDRFPDAAAMVIAVDAVLQTLEPAAPSPVTQPAPDQRRLPTLPVRPSRRRTLVIGGVAAVVALVVIVFVATHSGNASAFEQGDGDRRDAVGTTTPEKAAELLALGHQQFTAGKVQPALAAYERALRASPALGRDAQLAKNLVQVLAGKDVLATIMALDLLSSLTPIAHDAIITYASSGKLEPARRRAVMLAERDGVDAKIDRVQSWMLDLQQVTSCDDRRETIELLARSLDRRALAVLKKARATKCIEQDAAAAITRIEAGARAF